MLKQGWQRLLNTGTDCRLKLNGEMEHYKGVKRLAGDFGIIITPKG